MSKLIRENKANSNGLTIVEKNKYENITEVTHNFNGEMTIEEVIRHMVLGKLKEQKIISK